MWKMRDVSGFSLTLYISFCGVGKIKCVFGLPASTVCWGIRRFRENFVGQNRLLGDNAKNARGVGVLCDNLYSYYRCGRSKMRFQSSRAGSTGGFAVCVKILLGRIGFSATMWKTREALGFSLTICISTTGVAKINGIFGVPPAPPTNQKSIDEIELFWSARKTFFPFILARPLPNERDSLGGEGGRKKDNLFWPDLFRILGHATEFAAKIGCAASCVAKPILSNFHVNFFAIFWFFLTCQVFCC